MAIVNRAARERTESLYVPMRGVMIHETRAEEKKSAVVEYREKGTGAVIHKSFLAK
jgi:hypothetical protein